MIKIYALIDPREPDHIRLIAATIGRLDSSCYDLKLNPILVKRRKWIESLISEGITPKVKLLKISKNNLYKDMKKVIIDKYFEGNLLFNATCWLDESPED